MGTSSVFICSLCDFAASAVNVSHQHATKQTKHESSMVVCVSVSLCVCVCLCASRIRGSWHCLHLKQKRLAALRGRGGGETKQKAKETRTRGGGETSQRKTNSACDCRA